MKSGPLGATPLPVASIVGGFALGVLTVIGQKELPETFAGVANSAVIWTVFAFVAGGFGSSLRVASIAGAAVLVGAVVGYYVSVPILVEGAAANARSVVIWGVVAMIAGPVAGIAGGWWTSEVRSRRLVASGVAGGTFLAEGIRRLTIEPSDLVLGWAMVLIGLAIPIARRQPWRDRGVALLLAAGVVVCVWAAFWLVDAAFRG